MSAPGPAARQSSDAPPAKSGWKRRTILPLFIISGVANILYLGGSWFMMEVYDRVIPGRSLPTLIGLATLMAVIYAFQGILDGLRSLIMVRLGSLFSVSLGARLFNIAMRMAIKGGSAAARPLSDLEQVRRFVSGAGPTALLDLPWIPIYVGLCFAFHPLLGYVSIAGSLVLVAITIISDRMTAAATKRSTAPAIDRDGIADAAMRNAEVSAVLGMQQRLVVRWQEANARSLAQQQHIADITGGAGSLSKVLRMALQSLVLAIGAYLVITQQATGGIIIACSILTSRALAPVEQAIAHWRSFVGARQAWARISRLLKENGVDAVPLALPVPNYSLEAQDISCAQPGATKPIISGISFTLGAGDGLALVGQSGAGKSTLARALVGVWPALAGTVRLDGADIGQWDPVRRGAFLGYLPQDVELFSGTVAENISRFDEKASDSAIIAAAQAAAVHDLVLQLPQGYETQVGLGGSALSGGQRQRIGLARALYGDPFLVVLDEPNSNLDTEGDAALTAAITGIRDRGGIVVVVAHRPSALAGLNKVLVMNGGRLHSFGGKEEVLSQYLRRPDHTHHVTGAVANMRAVS